MTIETLEGLLQRGLGRAVLLLEKHYTPAYRETILTACRRFVGWDGQIEDSRAPYLFDVIHATSEPGFYEEAVLRALEEPDSEDDVGQLIGLVCRIARMGNKRARPILYPAVERRFSEGKAWDEDELIRLDGLIGFAFVVSLYLRYPQEDYRIYFPFFELEKQFGEAGVRPAVLQTVASFPELRDHCLDALAKWEANHAENTGPKNERKRSDPISYDQIRAEMAANPRQKLFPGRRKLAPEARERLAQDALAETDPIEKCRLLSLFREDPFPLPIAPLLPLVHAEEERLRFCVVSVLSANRHSTIRDLALTLAETPGREDDVMRLLVRNGVEEDGKRWLLLAERIDDEQVLHSFGMALRDLAEERPHPALVPVLRYLYEYGPCSLCRRFIVKHLAGFDALTDELRNECRYDAHAGTREFVAES